MVSNPEKICLMDERTHLHDLRIKIGHLAIRGRMKSGWGLFMAR